MHSLDRIPGFKHPRRLHIRNNCCRIQCDTSLGSCPHCNYVFSPLPALIDFGSALSVCCCCSSSSSSMSSLVKHLPSRAPLINCFQLPLPQQRPMSSKLIISLIALALKFRSRAVPLPPLIVSSRSDSKGPPSPPAPSSVVHIVRIKWPDSSIIQHCWASPVQVESLRLLCCPKMAAYSAAHRLPSLTDVADCGEGNPVLRHTGRWRRRSNTLR